MDRKDFKTKPFHVITDSRNGDIKRIITPGDLEVGTELLPADLKVYGSMLVDSIKDLDGNNYVPTEVIFQTDMTGSQFDAPPNQFRNLAMWFEANPANVSLDMTAPVSVQNWRDLSGNNRHLSQGTKARQPRWYAANPEFSGSMPSLEFQGGQVMSSSAVNITSYTIIVGVTAKTNTTLIFEHGPDSNTANGAWLHTSNAGAGASVLVKRSNVISAKDMPIAGWATQTDQPQIYTVHHSGTHASLRLLINNWDPQTLLTTSAGNNLGHTAYNDAMYVGARSTLAAPVSGSMFAFIVFTPAIPLFQAQKVVRYLGNKYGVPVV